MLSDKKRPLLKKNRWRICLLLLLLLSLFSTSGCWNNIEVNNTSEAEGLVLDLINDQPSISVQLAKPGNQNQTGASTTQPIANFTETGRTFTEAARRISLSLPRLPIWAHARVMILGENLANQDLALAQDFLARNRNARKTSLLFITKGTSGKACLEAEVPLESYSTVGLKEMILIQEQQLGIYMPVTIDQFLERLATPGIQPVAPQVTIQEIAGKKLLRLDGTAVFKDRKLAGSLDEMESRGYRFLQPRMINGGLIIINSPLSKEPNNKELLSIELTRSQAHISPQIEGNQIKKMMIEIEAEGNLYEQTFIGEVLTVENVKKVEELANQRIKADIAASIFKAQLLDSDIFGWGHGIYRTNPDLWNLVEKDWSAIFPGIEADITVRFSLRRTYLLDKSFEFKE